MTRHTYIACQNATVTGRHADVPLYDGLQPAAITDDLWEPVNYVAAWQQTDSADHEPVLKNQHRDDFWTLTGALQLVARA